MNDAPNLYEATKDLHHACEVHPVGQRMQAGAVTHDAWADWLLAFRVLHRAADRMLPEHMARDQLLAADLSVLPVGAYSPTAEAFAETLMDVEATGAAYVLHGAHRSGGRVLAPKLAKRGFPSLHVVYSRPDAVKEWLDATRGADAFRQQARDTFFCLLDVMDEIEARHG